MTAWFQQAHAQIDLNLINNGPDLNVSELKLQKKRIVNHEKESLKAEVKAIMKRVDDGEITKNKAEELKKTAAEKYARNIENQLDIIAASIALLKRNETEADYYRTMDYLSITEDTIARVEYDTIPDKTQSHLVIAFGMSNAVGAEQSIDESPYQIWGSRFFEIGVEFSTVLINSGYLRLNYGLSLQLNGLKPTDGRYFVSRDGLTRLENFPYKLDKAKLRLDNLVIPIHLEIGPTSDLYDADKFKFGLGGYFGLNLSTRQKLKYKKQGHRAKTKRIGSYNTSNFIYGLSAYVGYDWIALYAKYNLNTLFTNNPVETHGVAIGLRLMW